MSERDPYRLDMIWYVWGIIKDEPGIWTSRL